MKKDDRFFGFNIGNNTSCALSCPYLNDELGTCYRYSTKLKFLNVWQLGFSLATEYRRCKECFQDKTKNISERN
jgi:hypothetical protein